MAGPLEEPCDLCQEVAELRPYGPNGERICFPCAMESPQRAEAAFEALIARKSSAEAPASVRLAG